MTDSEKNSEVSASDLGNLLSTLSDEQVENACESILNEIELMKKFEKLSDVELVEMAISEYTDWTMHPIIEAMMNRLHPEWADETEIL